MKIALGMIVRGLKTGMKLMSFIEEAEKHEHNLESVIVAYSREVEEHVREKIGNKVPFYPVDIKNPEYCRVEMEKRGLSAGAIETLLSCPTPLNSEKGLVPYGHNRMTVVIEAILRGADILIFVDSDIMSSVLIMTPQGPVLKETDFFGAHLKHLLSDADVTTGEYSGYNILPPAEFEGMDDLLYGVKKGNMIEYWQNSRQHNCLICQPENVTPKPCNKILGGNLGIKLSALAGLPPFFSSYYISGDELFLCRGEDTVLGFEIAQLGMKCLDIGLYPLHDTYDNYPAVPDLKNDTNVQERLFYACTGWVGRNPFFNYILGKDPAQTREFQREHLSKGIPALVKYTSNPIYNRVLECFDDSWNSLDRYISEFQKTTEAWEEFKKGAGLK